MTPATGVLLYRLDIARDDLFDLYEIATAAERRGDLAHAQDQLELAGHLGANIARLEAELSRRGALAAATASR